MKLPIPIDSDKISERIFSNAAKLIEYSYWDGIQDHELISWIKNFNTDEEKYLAASILLNLIYRNKNAIRTFGAQIFQITIPNYLERKGIYNISCLDTWLKDLNSTNARSKFPFRFSTIEGIDNKPAKSGASIFRALKQDFFDANLGVGFQSYKTIQNKNNINTLILFDDILGTGEQFETFLEKNCLLELGLNILYCPFAANIDGLNSIKNKYESIDIIPVEILSEKNGLFSEANNLFQQDDICNANEFKEFYLTMCKSRGFRLKTEELLGKGELALTYLFNDSAPNNNIAALWYGEESWCRLVKR